MDIVSKIVVVAAACLMLALLYRYIKANPESLSLANLNKSFYTMGLMAVGLILFIAFVVYFLRQA